MANLKGLLAPSTAVARTNSRHPAKPMENLADIYRKELEEQRQRTSRTSSGGSFWGPKVGTNRPRVLPHPEKNHPFFFKVGQHYGLGPEGKSAVYCLQNSPIIDETCPICTFAEQLRKKAKRGSREDELASRIWVRNRILCVVLDQLNPDAGLQYWMFGPRIYLAILELINGEYPDLLSIESGYDLIVKRVGQDMEDTQYNVFPAKESSALPHGIMDQYPDVLGFVEKRMLTSVELDRVLEGEDPYTIIRERGSEEEAVTTTPETGEDTQGTETAAPEVGDIHQPATDDDEPQPVRSAGKAAPTPAPAAAGASNAKAEIARLRESARGSARGRK